MDQIPLTTVKDVFKVETDEYPHKAKVTYTSERMGMMGTAYFYEDNPSTYNRRVYVNMPNGINENPFSSWGKAMKWAREEMVRIFRETAN